jgi:hypothetical protein
VGALVRPCPLQHPHSMACHPLATRLRLGFPLGSLRRAAQAAGLPQGLYSPGAAGSPPGYRL